LFVAFYTLPHLVSRTLLFYYHHVASFFFFSPLFFGGLNHFSHHLILISHLYVDFFGDPPKIPSVVVVVPTPLYPTIEVVFWGQTAGRYDTKGWYQWQSLP